MREECCLGLMSVDEIVERNNGVCGGGGVDGSPARRLSSVLCGERELG